MPVVNDWKEEDKRNLNEHEKYVLSQLRPEYKCWIGERSLILHVEDYARLLGEIGVWRGLAPYPGAQYYYTYKIIVYRTEEEYIWNVILRD
jgi:hypothetical protein